MIEGVVPQDYEALCQSWAEDEDAMDSWRELRLALRGRNGWWFLDPRALQDYDGGPMWCFGDSAEPGLCLTPLDAGFGLYVADTEEEMAFDDITQVVTWLDTNQSKHEGLSPGLSQFLDLPHG